MSEAKRSEAKRNEAKQSEAKRREGIEAARRGGANRDGAERSKEKQTEAKPSEAKRSDAMQRGEAKGRSEVAKPNGKAAKQVSNEKQPGKGLKRRRAHDIQHDMLLFAQLKLETWHIRL